MDDLKDYNFYILGRKIMRIRGEWNCSGSCLMTASCISRVESSGSATTFLVNIQCVPNVYVDCHEVTR